MSLGAVEPSGHLDAAFGLVEGERLLLVLNPRTVGGRRTLIWDLPGGTVQPGETLPQALRREWQEETGLGCEVLDLVLVVDGAKRREEGGAPLYTWRAHFFRLRSAGEGQGGEGIEEVRWVPRKEAAGLLDAPYHGALRRHLEGDPAVHAEVSWVDSGIGAHPEPIGHSAGGLRHLLLLAAAAAVGDLDAAQDAAEGALGEGVGTRAVEEVLLQLVPYAGFPRAIVAFRRLRPLLGEPPPREEIVPPMASGYEVFDAVYGETARGIRAGLRTFHPELERWTLAFAYGRVLARPALALVERELLAVSTLTALGRLEPPLLGHMRAAIRLGASHRDLESAIQAVPERAGGEHRRVAEALLARVP